MAEPVVAVGSVVVVVVDDAAAAENLFAGAELQSCRPDKKIMRF